MIVGVDFDSFKAILCAVPFDGGAPAIAEARWRPDSRGGDALGVLGEVRYGLDQAKTDLRIGIGDRFLEENLYFVERGFGASRRSDFIMGAFFGAIYTVLGGAGDVVNLMEAREWKAEVTATAGIGLTTKGRGNPNARKEVANEACRALLLLEEVEAFDWTPDMLDAYGIAFTGRRLNQRALARPTRKEAA